MHHIPQRHARLVLSVYADVGEEYSLQSESSGILSLKNTPLPNFAPDYFASSLDGQAHTITLLMSVISTPAKNGVYRIAVYSSTSAPTHYLTLDPKKYIILDRLNIASATQQVTSPLSNFLLLAIDRLCSGPSLWVP